MAGPAGIEPVTDGLRVRCSALLSYGPTCFKKENRLMHIGLTVLNSEDSDYSSYFSIIWFVAGYAINPFVLGFCGFSAVIFHFSRFQRFLR